MIDKTSKTRRVLDGLEKVLEKAPDGFFLGTLPSLAAQWGVNERTIRRCTGHLYQSGRIHAVPGKGVLTGAARTCVSTPATPPGTVDTIAHFIATDIRSGVLKRGDTLPSIKTLAHTAHISRANASKAYALLESRGFLVRLGNRSMVTTARSVKSLPQPSEVIIVHQHHDIRVVMSAYDHQYPLTEMEVPGVPCPGGCFYRADK